MGVARYICAMVMMLACATPAVALTTQPPPAAPVRSNYATTDALIEGAKLCTRHLPRYEREYGIPTHLLSAIASTESGRYHKGLKIKLPWPWTINAEGKGYFFDSKAEAIIAARNLRARGVQSMDVGCMQVNLYHHAQAFSSLEQAFEPEHNIAYAASFLRNLYQEDGSWKNAAADYHSKTPQLGTKYVGLVYHSWYNIIDKLRAARLSVPDSSVKGLRDMAKAEATTQMPIAKSTPHNSYAYKPPRMNSITVRNSDGSSDGTLSRSRENGVIMVRSEIKKPDIRVVDDVSTTPIRSPETLTIAQVKQPLPAATIEPTAHIIRLDDRLVERRPVNAQSAPKSGPNFIFND